MAQEVVLRFDNVKFEYLHKRPILNDACFSIRRGAKITLMGQNGAGKSTIFKLINGDLQALSGQISLDNGASVGIAKQSIAPEDMDLNIEEYFSRAFSEVPKNIKSLIAKALKAVNFVIPLDKVIKNLSGGQQARILLAYSLLEDPDILLLDEPTNNLDKEGIDYLVGFILTYAKTVLVISHDADFLNCFTEGVIYLDSYTHHTEMYVGDYYSVVKEIERRVEREQRKNAQLEKQIKDRKEKVNFFAHKGGKMRKLAQKMKTETEELEENKVDVRKEDKTIRPFSFTLQDISGEIVNLKKIKIINNYEAEVKDLNLSLRKKDRLLVLGPNGIGKSTFLRSLVADEEKRQYILKKVKIGYYSQDFSNLNFSETVFESLKNSLRDGLGEQEMRSVAAGFLITGDLMGHKISDLSDGQKGLLSFARLTLMEIGLLILDEPTNHINFRHLPIIAEAINDYQGTIIMVSHMPDFVEKINFTDELNLGKI